MPKVRNPKFRIAQEFAKRIDQPLPTVLIDDIQKRTRIHEYLAKVEKKQYDSKLNFSKGYKSILKYKPF